MGLWLKCPGCHANNPLSLRVCSQCGQDLDNLSPAQRVYVLGPASAPAPKPAKTPAAPAEKPASAAPSAEAEAPPAAPKPKRPKKKKAQA